MRWNVDEYQRTVFERLSLPIAATSRVLDLGCGEGRDAEWLAERARETVGVDLAENARWRTISRPGLAFQVGNGENLDFRDNAFELVFMKDVLHHAGDPQRVLFEARRVCAPGGTICIVEGNRFNPLLYVHMTLVLGHQHFRRPAFMALVRRIFPNARFIHFEAHVYPLHGQRLLSAVHAIEAFIAKTPLIQRLASYNAAIAVR